MSFWRFFLVRLAWAVFGLWLAATVVFVITRVLVSPIEFCKESPRADRCYESFVERLDLNEPVHERYLHFLGDLVTHQSPGGAVWVRGPDSGRLARQALPATASLVGSALMFALALAAAAGIAWSRAARKWERFIRFPIYLAVGLSPVFIGPLLALLVGYEWPANNFGSCAFNPSADAGCEGPRDWLSYFVLPVVTLGLFFAGVYTRIVRAGIARIRAAPSTKERRRLSRRFVLVLARVAGRDFGWAIGIAILVESIFVRPGLARTGIVSVSNADVVLLEAVVLYAAFLAIAVHFVVDVIVGALDGDLRAEWPVAGMPRPA